MTVDENKIKEIIMEKAMEHAYKQVKKFLNSKNGFKIGETITLTLHLKLEE
jgi:effector-binding domain-containing protein